MHFINKKLVKLYTNSKKNIIFTKSKSSIITKDLLGKCIYVYNGRKWVRKNIDKHYFLYRKIGTLKNINTKIVSGYKNKKKKKKTNK